MDQLFSLFLTDIGIKIEYETQDNFFMLIRYLEQSPFPAEAAYVGLAPRGAPRSWQLDAKVHYTFA
mgnify:CR=1